jgi:two-component system, NarL family, response regulator YdfI
MSKQNGGGGIRVVVAAASAVRRAGLESIVRGEPDLHLAASTGSSARLDLLARNANADVVLVDSDSALPAVPSSAAIILLMEVGGAREISRLLKAGVHAILSRESDADDIVAAIYAACRGQVLLSSEAAERLAAVFRDPEEDPEKDPEEESAVVEEMTPREIEILGLLAEGLANKEVAMRLRISEHTIKFHISSILEKMGAATRTEAVTLGIRRGLIAI